MANAERDRKYLSTLLDPIRRCATYRPKFGTNDGEGITLEQFKSIYGADAFYHWIGLDSPLMYAAHKAAGGMTSIYRQLGNGCEQLLRGIIRDQMSLDAEQTVWKYQIERRDKTKQTITLDARIDINHLKHGSPEKARVERWIHQCGVALGMSDARIRQLNGAVFEVRQGYKSADAKRQNADLNFGINAQSSNYLPIVAVVSNQVSETVIRRYRNARMLVTTGTVEGDSSVSTFAFFKEVIGYDLASFLKRNSTEMRQCCEEVLNALLTPN